MTLAHLAVEVGGFDFALPGLAPMSEQQQPHRWKVRDTLFSPWRELPGRYTATEIGERRSRGEFKVAVPIVENGRKEAIARDLQGRNVI